MDVPKISERRRWLLGLCATVLAVALLAVAAAFAGNSATMQGKTTVDRLAYEIGTESDGSGTFVSWNVLGSWMLDVRRPGTPATEYPGLS